MESNERQNNLGNMREEGRETEAGERMNDVSNGERKEMNACKEERELR